MSAQQDNFDESGKFLEIDENTFQSAQNFLDSFGYNITTLAVQLDKPDADTQRGKLLWTGKKGSSVVAIKGQLLDSQDLVDDIILTQNQAMSLWFMVNEGDGVIYDPNVTPRSQKNVHTLKACFVDTDDGDISKLISFTKENDCPYHFKVESSPGKFHVYFMLEDTEATDDNILKWEAIQRTLMNLDPRYDRSVADISQLLRVPFFYHNKKAPWKIKLSRRKGLPKYSLDDLYELTGAHTFVKINGQGDRFEYPTEKVDSGNRHYSMMAYLRSATNKGVTAKEDLLNLAVGFAINEFSDHKPFLPGGSRWHEVEHNVESVLSYAREEEKKRQLESLSNLEAQNKKRSSFHLDEQFFYDCPNEMLASMVKHSAANALYPCPSYDFAAFVVMFGHLKSHLFVSNRGHPPVNYLLCFGPSGVGKDWSQRIVSRALEALGERGLATELKTAKGLYRGLAENGSRSILMLDEVEGLLSMLTGNNQNVESYTRALKDCLLRFYSNWNRTYTSPMTGNEKEKPYVIPHPHLNVIGYGTPTALSHGFSLKSISDGLLPRFMILKAPDVREANPDYNPKAVLTSEQLDYLREKVMAGKCKKEADFIEVNDLENELAELKAISGNRSKDEKARMTKIAERLQQLSSGGRSVGQPSVINFTEKAGEQYEAFMHKMDQLYNKAGDSPVKAIYTRVAEKVGRLATVIADERIDSKLLEWCIAFAEHQLEAELDAIGTSGEGLNSELTWEERQYQRLLKCIEALSSKEEPYARKRDISRRMKLGGTALDKIIKIGLEREEIRATELGKSGERGRPKGEAYSRVFEI